MDRHGYLDDNCLDNFLFDGEQLCELNDKNNGSKAEDIIKMYVKGNKTKSNTLKDDIITLPKSKTERPFRRINNSISNIIYKDVIKYLEGYCVDQAIPNLPFNTSIIKLTLYDIFGEHIAMKNCDKLNVLDYVSDTYIYFDSNTSELYLHGLFINKFKNAKNPDSKTKQYIARMNLDVNQRVILSQTKDWKKPLEDYTVHKYSNHIHNLFIQGEDPTYAIEEANNFIKKMGGSDKTDILKSAATSSWKPPVLKQNDTKNSTPFKATELHVSHKSNPKLQLYPHFELLHKTTWMRKLDNLQFTFKHFRIPEQLTVSTTTKNSMIANSKDKTVQVSTSHTLNSGIQSGFLPLNELLNSMGTTYIVEPTTNSLAMLQGFPSIIAPMRGNDKFPALATQKIAGICMRLTFMDVDKKLYMILGTKHNAIVFKLKSDKDLDDKTFYNSVFENLSAFNKIDIPNVILLELYTKFKNFWNKLSTKQRDIFISKESDTVSAYDTYLFETVTEMTGDAIPHNHYNSDIYCLSYRENNTDGLNISIRPENTFRLYEKLINNKLEKVVPKFVYWNGSMSADIRKNITESQYKLVDYLLSFIKDKSSSRQHTALHTMLIHSKMKLDTELETLSKIKSLTKDGIVAHFNTKNSSKINTANCEENDARDYINIFKDRRLYRHKPGAEVLQIQNAIRKNVIMKRSKAERYYQAKEHYDAHMDVYNKVKKIYDVDPWDEEGWVISDRDSVDKGSKTLKYHYGKCVGEIITDYALRVQTQFKRRLNQLRDKDNKIEPNNNILLDKSFTYLFAGYWLQSRNIWFSKGMIRDENKFINIKPYIEKAYDIISSFHKKLPDIKSTNEDVIRKGIKYSSDIKICGRWQYSNMIKNIKTTGSPIKINYTFIGNSGIKALDEHSWDMVPSKICDTIAPKFKEHYSSTSSKSLYADMSMDEIFAIGILKIPLINYCKIKPPQSFMTVDTRTKIKNIANNITKELQTLYDTNDDIDQYLPNILKL